MTACAPSDVADHPATEEAIATFEGGEVTISELRAAMRQDGNERKADLRQRSEEMVAALAVRKVLAAELDRELRDGVEWDEASQRARFDLWIARQRQQRPVRIEPEEVASFYERHREELVKPQRRFLSYIYLRVGEDRSRQEAERSLEELATAVRSGASFQDLAREHSESETRTLGGRLGWVASGHLPATVEAQIFSLQLNELSRPVEVAGGLALFLCQGIDPGGLPDLEDLRGPIQSYLLVERLVEWFEELAVGLPDPIEDPTVREAAAEAVLANREEELLPEAMGHPPILASDLRRDLLVTWTEQAQNSEVLRRTEHDLAELLLRRASALHRLRVDLAGAEPDRELLDLAEAQARAELLDERLVDEFDRRLRALVPEAELERFHLREAPILFDDRELLVASLRVDIARFGSPESAERAMAGVRAEIAAGADSEGSIRAIGGSFSRLGWRTPRGFSEILPNKAAAYLSTVVVGELTDPFRVGPDVHMLELIDERRKPLPELSSVRDEVLEQYVNRNRSSLLETLRGQVLAEVDYILLSDRLDEWLTLDSAPEADREPGS